jgi:hypothetical protein
MGKYDDLFDAGPAPSPAPVETGKYSDLFDKPSVAVTQDYAPEIPSGAELTQIGRENTPAWTEAPAQAVSELVGGMVPRDIPSYLESIYPSAAAGRLGGQLSRGDVSGIPLVGRIPEIAAADETPAFSKERYLTALKTLMDVGALAGAKTPESVPIRGEPLAPEPPPTQSMGPGTIADNVRAAIREQGVPEANRQLAPEQPTAPSMAEATVPAPNVREALSLDEMRLMRERDELQVQNDIAQRATGQTHPAVDERLDQIDQDLTNIANRELQPVGPPPVPIGTPLQPMAPLLGPEGTTAADLVQSQSVPTEVTVQTPVSPNGGVSVAETPPEPYTPEAAALRSEQQSSRTGLPPVAETGNAGIGEGGISIKNEYTDTQRRILGFPEAVKEASRDFGTVWNEAEATDRLDPGAKGRLVEAINDGKVKALDDHGDALLLREQIRAQGEHNDAVKAVNEAATDADKTAAKVRLEQARDDLQAVYDADRKAGRSTAQGLNARKMLTKEDYSLTAMEARKRAANNGERLSDEQLKHTEALHTEITELSNGLDGLEQLRREGKQGAASGKRFTDVLNEQAQKARERLIAKRGRLNAGIDPTNLVDEAIIGASHIANGLTKFADWSAQMVRDFGDRIKPFLKDLWDRARTYHDATKKASRSPEEIRLERYKTRLAKDTAGVTAKIQREDFTKPTRQQLVLDKAAYKMKGNLQRLKNEFERGVAKDAYNKMSPGDKFWQHFVGVERAMKLSSPGVFQKLGLAAAVREVLAPVEAAGGYAASTFFPRLAKGTRYGADLGTITRAELKAKAAFFTEGMKDSWQNLKGKETELEALSDKYGRQPDFWYNRIGKIHAAVKAPVKRAEFTRSLELKMDAAAKAGRTLTILLSWTDWPPSPRLKPTVPSSSRTQLCPISFKWRISCTLPLVEPGGSCFLS